MKKIEPILIYGALAVDVATIFVPGCATKNDAVDQAGKSEKNALGMAAHQARHSPIIHHVVNVLDRPLRLRVAALVVYPKIMAVGDVAHRIRERTEPLRIDAFADDAILKRNVAAALREAETIPSPPWLPSPLR